MRAGELDEYTVDACLDRSLVMALGSLLQSSDAPGTKACIMHERMHAHLECSLILRILSPLSFS
jgi:hypothetical protein